MPKNKVTLIIDTEFNGMNGQLISMALVPVDRTQCPFYAELLINEHVDVWVSVNVCNRLDRTPITVVEFQERLETYLGQWEEVTVVADWPDDISYFCKALITGPGTAILTPKISFIMDRSLVAISAAAHHALYDAVAIRDVYVTQMEIDPITELKGALNDILNDCINFDGSKLTDVHMANATAVLAKYT
jgi:hypothetical protein